MWKNVVELGRPQNTIWRMHIACWIPNAKNIHSGCVIHIAFPQQQWLHERASMLRYTYIACLVLGLQTANAYLTQKGLLNNLITQTQCPRFDTRRLVYGTKSGQILTFTQSPFQQLPYHISSRIKECAA